MKNKTLLIFSIYFIASNGFASMQDCCFQARNMLDSDDIICDSELKISKQIGEDLKSYTGVRFGVSKEVQGLPLKTKTGVIKKIPKEQNVGFILKLKSDNRVVSVVPSLKNIDKSSKRSCYAIKYNNLDKAYNDFINLKQSLGLAIQEPKLPKNKCLLSIKDSDSILGSAYMRQLRTSFLKRDIYLLPAGKEYLSQVQVELSQDGLKYKNNQFDLDYRSHTAGNKKVAKMTGRMHFDYGHLGLFSLNLNGEYNISRVTNQDQLDFAVIQKRVLNGLNIKRCKSASR